MLRNVSAGPPRALAAACRNARLAFGTLVVTGMLALFACSEAVGPSVATNREDMPVIHAVTEAAAARPGIGGSFFMAAGGSAITPVDLQATGIEIPAGTQVQVEVGGTITRAHTAGLTQFCALAHMKSNCAGPWAEILRTTPIVPSGGSGPRAMVAWDAGEPAFPDSGTGLALAGPAAGELWAGRSGLECWYVDHVTGIQGACFEFGGGYSVTVAARPEVTIGGGGAGSIAATLSLEVLSSTVGPAGGLADLEASIATVPDSAPPPEAGFTRWYFIRDSERTTTGTPVPSPFDLRASARAAESPSHPVRLDSDRVQLPDGRVVGSGIHVTSRRVGAGQGGALLDVAASEAATSYPECDGTLRCGVRFDAPSGTFVISTKLGGVPVSASARVGVVQGGGPARVQIVRVAGPNAGGSFTTRENEVVLEASVPAGHDGTVGWEFVDDPGDDVASPHVVVGDGVTTTATIGHSPGGSSRWPAGHPGRLDQKAFRYTVRAFTRRGGVTEYSDPVVLQQDVVDVIRQEFIDYETPAALTPARAAFVHARPGYAGIYQHSPASESGLGDYCVTGGGACTTLVSDRLSPFLTWLQAAWKHQPPLVVTSIFRNPVHHHSHSPRARNNSPHKYGTAVDYDVAGEDKSPQQRLHWSALRNTGLRYPAGGICAETWYLGQSWAGNHVHFDRRYGLQSPCLDTWKVPEAIGAQQSMSPLGGGAHDSLLVMLAGGDAGARLAAASALAELPLNELPSRYAEVALQQLNVEIARRSSGAESVPESVPEEYGAYLLELARLVHRSENPAAAPSLARLGIEVSLGIRRFVARHAAQSIPSLENSWTSDESLHADIIGTYGEMLRFQADSGWQLPAGELAIVDRAFLRAAGGGVVGQWGLAFHAGQLGLVEFAPLLSLIASQAPPSDDPFGLVAAAAADGLALLATTRVAAGRDDLMRTMLRIQASVCADASGQRLGQCTALRSALSNASRALGDGSSTAARAALVTFRDLLDRAAERGVFTAIEYRLLADNALAIVQKLE